MSDMKIVRLAQDTPEWHAFRATHFGASDAAAACNAGKFHPHNREELVESFRTGKRNVYVPAVNHGKAHEADARRQIESMIGVTLEPVVCEREVNGLPLSASLDGMDLDGDIHEIKVPYSGARSETWKLACRDLVPEYYTYQLEHQLLVTGKAVNNFWVFVHIGHRKDCRRVTYRTDPARRNVLLAGWSEVQKMLAADPIPPPAGRDDQDWREAADEYRLAERLFVEAETRKAEARDRLLALAGDADAEGCGVAIRWEQRKGNVDYSKIEVLRGIDLDQYRKAAISVAKIAVKP